jgi:hypothetical protein
LQALAPSQLSEQLVTPETLAGSCPQPTE